MVIALVFNLPKMQVKRLAAQKIGLLSTRSGWDKLWEFLICHQNKGSGKDLVCLGKVVREWEGREQREANA